MKNKFLFTRSYSFTPLKGRKMLFELVESRGADLSFKPRNRDNHDMIPARRLVGRDLEIATFSYQGVDVVLRADQYLPKGFSVPRGMSETEFPQWQKTREDLVKNAYLYSVKNREEIHAAKMCGCYDCQHIFPAEEIEEWTDGGLTAVCPFCGTDAVIPHIPGIVKLSRELLSALNERYF